MSIAQSLIRKCALLSRRMDFQEQKTNAITKIQAEFNEALLDLLWLQDPHEHTLRSTNDHLNLLAGKYRLIISSKPDHTVDIQAGIIREVMQILLDSNARLAALTRPNTS